MNRALVQHLRCPDDGVSRLILQREQLDSGDQLHDDVALRFELETYDRQLQVRPGEAILDVGCGTGRVTKQYLPVAGLVVAADFSVESLKFLMVRVQPELRQRILPICCEVGHLPFPDKAHKPAISD